MKSESPYIFKDTLFDMTWPEVEALSKRTKIVLIPVGTIEQHGPHMPLGTDTYCSLDVCAKIKNFLKEEGVDSAICPPFLLGICDLMFFFPGTFTTRESTMIESLKDISGSLQKHGFVNQVFVNFHGEKKHILTLHKAVHLIRTDIGLDAAMVVAGSFAKRIGLDVSDPALVVTTVDVFKFDHETQPSNVGLHGGPTETSFMMNAYPELVRRDLIETLDPCWGDVDIWRKGGDYTKAQTPLGYFGDVSKSRREIGKQASETWAKEIATLIMKKYIKGEQDK